VVRHLRVSRWYLRRANRALRERVPGRVRECTRRSLERVASDFGLGRGSWRAQEHKAREADVRGVPLHPDVTECARIDESRKRKVFPGHRYAGEHVPIDLGGAKVPSEDELRLFLERIAVTSDIAGERRERSAPERRVAAHEAPEIVVRRRRQMDLPAPGGGGEGLRSDPVVQV